MKKSNLVKFLKKNIPITFFSFLFGYSYWHLYSQNQSICKNITVPISFYNLSYNKIILDAPEFITVSFEGKRKDFYRYDFDNLACHINGETLNNGTNYINLDEKSFFLPNTLHINYVSPFPCTVKISM